MHRITTLLAASLALAACHDGDDRARPRRQASPPPAPPSRPQAPPPAPLPATRPADFDLALERVSGSGMEPATTVTVSASGGAVAVWPDAVAGRGTFPITATDLDALYATVRAVDPDHIGFHAGAISDDGRRSIVLHAGGATHEVLDESGHVIDPQDASRYQAVADAVDALVARAPHVTLVLAFDPSLRGEAWIDPGYHEVGQTIDATGRVPVPVLPGEYHVNVTVRARGRGGDADPRDRRGATIVRTAGATTVVHVHDTGAELRFD